ncbi:high-affinity branched-chain amino acid ABC transporter permease LivH [Pseudomonas fluorescens]|uniref:high-affinity branched-chain amino acid ABC transporter permease LivH n=1 Tax=Pseudomonas fluorescens TaxID=294 RepID=UPI0017820BE1|nr:high-affinity branched-chain amino acid ABC transporter permease LivH [Pseudomonas fluorescens]MBD8146744.1 high-affinity branched-chain amino acid ABC transporter permease LivH [Pseudomonas fluorescens]MBD8175188.1 high-affinity branched-chain amino acid ABC transporter permease LivH [Pseudomonas fluorescens]MBD8743644.1 high-affinity branched-chain amino acid ABC transporter permease LivH [Pseudomonas fluorescens]MBD8753469.1 high-affinity branched-chain amino acid ABC transporter permease
MNDLYYYTQLLINGLSLGSTYALIAIGYTMVYGIIGMINFAHGEVYMIGSYIAFIALTGLAMMGVHSLPILITVALIASIVVTSAYGYSIERVAYRPLRNSNRLIPLISAIGMSILLQNTVLLSQDSKDKAIPSLIPGAFSFRSGESAEILISYMQILVFATTLVAMVCLALFISRSRLGRACRACAEDIKMANLLGINTNNIIALTFVIGAALAAVAAVLLGMQYGVINPNAGFLIGLKAFTAAVLGGIGSIPGAMLGGLVLGVAEAFGAHLFGDQYKDVVAFTLLVLILLFRPTGILGRPEVEKV